MIKYVLKIPEVITFISRFWKEKKVRFHGIKTGKQMIKSSSGQK